MRTFNTIKPLKAALTKLKASNQSIGFVPTMGALHEGHLSLIRKSRRENDITVLSIYVNPKQFDDKSDFKNYPQEIKKDKKLAKKENVDIIFYPSEKTMYPTGYLTYIDVGKITHTLCGLSRPGHFKGVTTVVGKLLNIVAPNRLYLGAKDAQQTVVIRRMIEDLNIPVTVRVCPTVREKDGLALSSRNKHLSEQQRREACTLYQSLQLAKSKIKMGERNVSKIEAFIKKKINTNSSGTIDYVKCVDADTLMPLKRIHKKLLIALAVKFDKARLIDNITIRIR